MKSLASRSATLLAAAVLAAACGGRLSTADSSRNDGKQGEPRSLDDPGRAPFDCSGTASTPLVSLGTVAGGDSIGVDSSYVYFSAVSESAVKRVPFTGGEQTVVDANEPGVRSLRVHDGRVCASAVGIGTLSIWCSSTTGASAELVLAAPLDPNGQQVSFDFDATSVYYAYPPYIFYAPLDGSAAPRIVFADDEPRQPFSPASVSIAFGYLYWMSITSDGHGSVRRCATGDGDCNVETIATFDGDEFSELALSTTHAYWTSTYKGLGNVWRAPLSGGRPALLASCAKSDPIHIAVDDHAVYWVSSDNYADDFFRSSIWSLPLDGTPAQKTASVEATHYVQPVFSIAARGGRPFWTVGDFTDSTIWSVDSP